jgi:hypothetical protein
MTEKQVLLLVVGVFFLAGAIYPKPIRLRATGEPHPYQLLARFCFAGFGLLMLLTSYLERNSK